MDDHRWQRGRPKGTPSPRRDGHPRDRWRHRITANPKPHRDEQRVQLRAACEQVRAKGRSPRCEVCGARLPASHFKHCGKRCNSRATQRRNRGEPLTGTWIDKRWRA